MKKTILAVALMILAAATAAIATEAPNPFDKPALEMRHIGDEAAMSGMAAASLLPQIVMIPIEAISYPSRLTEIGDDYAKMIPGTFGRFAARASLAPFRLAFAVPAAPWYAVKYVAGLYSGSGSATN